MRVVLLACLVGHLSCATILVFRARARRGPVRRKGLPLWSFAARGMPVTGVVLLAFVISDILQG
jgi:succinate dehydrogenase / fumarate reductase, cytochrome b subunit